MKQIDEIRGADGGRRGGAELAQPGELMLVQADTIDETVEYVRQYLDALNPAPAAPVEPAAAEVAVGRDGPNAGGRGGPKRTSGPGPRCCQGRADRAMSVRAAGCPVITSRPWTFVG